MTDDPDRDFEERVRRMLASSVAGLPESYEATSGLVRRARRRRAARLTAVVATVVLVATGTTTAVAQVLAQHTSARVVTAASAPSTTAARVPATTAAVETSTTLPIGATTPSTSAPSVGAPTVPTVACPFTFAGPSSPAPTGPMAARVPAAGDPSVLAQLVSFAATSAPKYIVLGPSRWSCDAHMYEDGRGSVVLFDPANGAAVPADDRAPVAIDNDWLWHGGVGSVTACSVFDDPTVVQYVRRYYPSYLPCPRSGRTVTSLDAHVSTFVDADGARGAGWVVLPSTQGGDGFITVLTCRPTAELTAADCDTIVADFAARLRGAG